MCWSERMLRSTTLAAACGALLLTGCDRPAGIETSFPGYGNATRNALAVQTGAVGAATALDRRFEAEVPTAINFPFDSAILTPQARTRLDAQAAFMRAFPEVRFSVFGHTDLVGSDAYNQGLGLRRAQAAVAYLGSRGVSLARLVAVVSRGERDPLVAAPGPVEANRRTVTQVTGFVADNALVLDGRYAQIVYRNYLGSSGRFASTLNQTGEAGGAFGITSGSDGGGGAEAAAAE